MVPPTIPARVSGASELERIITPYNADAFERTLVTLGLQHRHPDLANNLRSGFPIGNFPSLSRTSRPRNHKRGVENMDFILAYAAEQVELGRMTGPYTQDEVEQVLGSPFVSSPLTVVPKSGGAGLRLVQDCSFVNEQGFSVNSFIDSDDFPTRWGTAAKFAQKVSQLSFPFVLAWVPPKTVSALNYAIAPVLRLSPCAWPPERAGPMAATLTGSHRLRRDSL